MKQLQLRRVLWLTLRKLYWPSSQVYWLTLAIFTGAERLLDMFVFWCVACVVADTSPCSW